MTEAELNQLRQRIALRHYQALAAQAAAERAAREQQQAKAARHYQAEAANAK